MKLSICYFGNAVLRKNTQPVEKITDEIKTLVKEMTELMDSLQGVGLAAPQVGVSLQLFIIRPVVIQEGQNPKLGEVMVFINPVLSHPSEQKEIMNEGCLSFPGLHLSVERPMKIHVEALGLDGKKFELDAVGFLARQIMHENDHIHAKLFIDHIKNVSKDENIKSVLHMIKEKNP